MTEKPKNRKNIRKRAKYGGVFLVFLLVSFMVSMMKKIKELDEFNFHQMVEESKGVFLVFFTGPHCGSCHHLRDLFVAEEIQFTSHFSEFSVFEIKADKASALVNEFNVFHLPTIFLYNDGQFHCELQTQAHPKKIIEAIELALKIPPNEEP